MTKQEYLIENQGDILQNLLSQHHLVGLRVDHYLSRNLKEAGDLPA
jgi:hypothetical protein